MMNNKILRYSHDKRDFVIAQNSLYTLVRSTYAACLRYVIFTTLLQTTEYDRPFITKYLRSMFRQHLAPNILANEIPRTILSENALHLVLYTVTEKIRRKELPTVDNDCTKNNGPR